MDTISNEGALLMIKRRHNIESTPGNYMLYFAEAIHLYIGIS